MQIARSVLAVLALAAASCSHAQEPAAVSNSESGKSAPPEALAAFETVHGVLQSPRCVNCHPAGDQPLQGDDSHVHLQFVQRGPEGRGVPGLACATSGKISCNQLINRAPRNQQMGTAITDNIGGSVLAITTSSDRARRHRCQAADR